MLQPVLLSCSNVGLYTSGVPRLCHLKFGDTLSRAIKVTSQSQQMVDCWNEFARDLRLLSAMARWQREKSYPIAGLVFASASSTLLKGFVATAMGRIVSDTRGAA
jgi:hypothetical protein